MSLIRIAHVNTSTGFSGGEVQVFLLMRGLLDHGIESLLVCPPGSESERRARHEGFAVLPLRLRNDSDLPGMLRLARSFRQAGVSLVHLHSGRAIWLGSLAARRARLPVVATKRMDRRVRRGPKSYLIWHRLVDRAVAISPAVQELFLAYGVPRKKVRLICSVVDPARVEPAGVLLDERCQPNDAVCTVLFAGSLNHRKGVDVLLNAMARLKGDSLAVRAWILGVGPEEDALRAQRGADGLEENVSLLGAKTNMADYLRAADVFVMPSRAEGMGVAVLEAMAAGLPVIASRVGGLAFSVVDGQTGLLVPPGDPEALATAIRRLAMDAQRREAMGRSGQERMRRHFMPGQMVSAYMALYREVLGRSADGDD